MMLIYISITIAVLLFLLLSALAVGFLEDIASELKKIRLRLPKGQSDD
jgi:type III secretory pathway component EscT